MTSIIGMVRFSVLSTIGAAYVAYREKTFDEIAAHILDEERLTMRFRLFETICLPSLDAQDDPDFAILIVAPRLMPDHWKERLSFLQAERSYLRVHYFDENEFRISDASAAIRDELVDSGDLFYTFRLDDDDALACNFISRVRRYLQPAFTDHAISFCKGYFLDISSDGYRIAERISPNLAVGFGYVAHRSSPRTMFDVSDRHLHAHYHMPVITHGARDAFVAVTHGANDSGNDRRFSGDPMPASDAGKFLREKGFNVNVEVLDLLSHSAYPTSSIKAIADTFQHASEQLTVGRRALAMENRHERRARKFGKWWEIEQSKLISTSTSDAVQEVSEEICEPAASS